MNVSKTSQAADMEALRARADAGEAEAMRQLFTRLDETDKNEEAFVWLSRLAQSGDLASRVRLGERMVVGFKAPQKPDEGARAIALAGEAGSPEGLHGHAILAATGVGRPQSWRDAFALIEAAARAGHALAAPQLALLAACGLRSGQDMAAFLTPPETVVKLEAPRILMADGILPEPMCRWLIERAQPKLYRAPVFAPRGGSNAHQIRTNTAAGFGLFETDLVIQAARARVAAALGFPVVNQEPPQVLHYAEEERYLAHWDYFDPSVPAYRRHIEWGGQRVLTALVYLNAGFDGGETGFPRLDTRLKASAGGLLAFRNVTPDGVIDPRTLHEGCPVVRGEKWLLSIWVRDRAHIPA